MVFSREEDALDRIRKQGSDEEGDALAKRKVLLAHMNEHPWNTLTAKDIDGKPIVFTKDEKSGLFRPFPDRDYLKHYVYTLMDPSIAILIVEKNRQIMASFTALLVEWWRILHLEAQNVFISRKKKETSMKLIEDKIRDTHRKLPKWLKAEWRITEEPKDIIRCPDTGSQIMAVPMTFAKSESRGDSASSIVVDESAYQDELPNIMTAAISMARRITLISSPNARGLGGQTMQAYIKKVKEFAYREDKLTDELTITRAKAPGSSHEMALFSVVHRTEEQTSKGWLYLNDSARRQEAELDWTHTDGNAYFSEATLYGGREVYSKPCTELDINLPIERGFDFGVMRPACVWGQVDPVNVKIHVVGAILGEDIDPWSFAIAVRYISGEIDREALGDHLPALRLIEKLEKDGMPPFPWFDRGFSFRNWAGHEANRPLPTGPGQKILTSTQIFEAEGIHLNPMFVPKERREFILRHLLKPRKEDKTPSILIDPDRAPIILNGILHGLVRPLKVTSKENVTEEPVDDHYYKDPYDALGYILTGTFNHVDWSGIQFTSKGLVRDNMPFIEVNRPKRWEDTGSNTRKPLVSSPYSRW